jgi:hypothetical protein
VDDADAAPFFPATSVGFCLDPNGGAKAYGDDAALALERICDLFDGECEVYKRYGVRRVVEVRFVDGGGSPATIDIHLSRFASTEGAYAMLTERLVGDGDPADEATPRPIEGGGVAALGLGNAYVWRGPYLAEITYNDESAGESAIRAAGDRALPPLVQAIGAKLPGETAPPSVVTALPKEARLPLGVRLVTGDALGVRGAGAGAYGYYREGDRRYRMLVLLRSDADQARDALSAFSKVPAATREKGIGDGLVRAMIREGDGVEAEWLVASSGAKVVGIGDEARALRSGMSAEEHAKVTLSREEKAAKLKKALGGAG